MAAETETTVTPPTRADLSRRGVIRGAAVGGLVLPVLAACGGDDTTATTPEASTPDASTPEEGGSGVLTTTADVPVGGGTVLPDAQVVVTQPSDGDFKAFTAVCTHQGCIVASVADGTINCDCHGSKFSIADGSVQNGPATSPLEAVEITVDGDQIVEG